MDFFYAVLSLDTNISESTILSFMGIPYLKIEINLVELLKFSYLLQKKAGT